MTNITKNKYFIPLVVLILASSLLYFGGFLSVVGLVPVQACSSVGTCYTTPGSVVDITGITFFSQSKLTSIAGTPNGYQVYPATHTVYVKSPTNAITTIYTETLQISRYSGGSAAILSRTGPALPIVWNVPTNAANGAWTIYDQTTLSSGTYSSGTGFITIVGGSDITDTTTNFVFNVLGTSTVTAPPPSGVTCPTNYYLTGPTNNVCCPLSTVYNSATNTCAAPITAQCQPGQADICQNGNVVACNINSQLVTSQVCPSSQPCGVYNGFAICTAGCTNGQIVCTGTNSYNKCTAGTTSGATVWQTGVIAAGSNVICSGNSLQTCTGGQININGVCSCASGQIVVNGQCQATATSCSTGQILVAGQCTTPPPPVVPTCTSTQVLIAGVCTTPQPPQVPYNTTNTQGGIQTPVCSGTSVFTAADGSCVYCPSPATWYSQTNACIAQPPTNTTIPAVSSPTGIFSSNVTINNTPVFVCTGSNNFTAFGNSCAYCPPPNTWNASSNQCSALIQNCSAGQIVLNGTCTTAPANTPGSVLVPQTIDTNTLIVGGVIIIALGFGLYMVSKKKR